MSARPASPRTQRLTALLVFCLSLGALSSLSWWLEQRRSEAQRATILTVAGDQAQAIESRIQRLMSATYLLAAIVRVNQGQVPQFEEVVTELLPFYPGVTSLSLSPGGVVRHAVPAAGNQALLGFDQLADPLQGTEAQRARDTGELTLAGPMTLVQGGLGAVGRLPIYLPDPPHEAPRFWGFANVALRFPEALAATGLEGLSELGYDYALWRLRPDTGERQTIAASANVLAGQPLVDPVNKALRVPNAEWQLSLAPRDGWGQPLNLGLFALGSVLFSALLAYLVHLLLAQRSQQARLEQEVAARTRDIEATRQDLQATLSAVPDLMFDLDATGVIHEVHAQSHTDLLLPRDSILGRNLRDFLPAQAGEQVMAALDEASRQGRSMGRQYSLPLPHGQQWFELSITAKAPLARTAASPPRFIALARNITARKDAETQHALAAEFFNGSSEGFVITDAQQRIIQVNPAFTAITGYPEADILGQTPALLSSGRHGADFYATMWQEIEAQGHWQGEVWNQRQNGEQYPEWLSISRVRDSQGQTTHYIAIFSDISRRREQEARIRHLAYFDPLTGLANRTLLRERVEHDLSVARRHQTPLSLLFIDLDHFKQVNDSLGHQVGDELLNQVAQRIGQMVREQDTVARLGGDEFVAVLPDTGAAGATHMAKRLLERLSAPYLVAQQELTVTPSIGIGLFPEDGPDFEALYRCADTAMYRAKQEGRNRFAFFTHEMQALSIRRLQLENALRRAVERGELSLHYQPQASLRDGRVVGVEALLRWEHPEWGSVSPAEFIPIAEGSGQILAIGEWVLEQACDQMQRWRSQGLGELVVAVNLSAVQFRQPQLPAQVQRILARTGLPPHCLELELTESTASHDPEAAIATMNELRQLGLLLSVDDFGTGYSSLNHLKRFSVHKLKIDQSFVRDIPDDADDANIVETIVQMAHSLGLVTIAEGVETAAQRDFLRQRGCDEMQGYLLGRPLPANGFEAWLRGRLSPNG
ncbi:EAL domain-containing protein [Aquabacterium sp. A08]|uniref:bifunctional diguanylate cyclase/phosphodiesterase n=1 Tax=Aquabacterium sp. A08 TaxID=2718532 RepID=UPI001AAE844C|nr:EAL domain-containing protein [Aquabacterium sp. A08]